MTYGGMIRTSTSGIPTMVLGQLASRHGMLLVYCSATKVKMLSTRKQPLKTCKGFEHPERSCYQVLETFLISHLVQLGMPDDRELRLSLVWHIQAFSRRAVPNSRLRAVSTGSLCAFYTGTCQASLVFAKFYLTEIGFI